MKDIVSQQQWEDAVLDSDKVLVEFFAEWCSHCRHMKEVVEQVESELADRADVARLDIDLLPDISSLFASSVPTFVMFVKGIPRDYITGECSAETLMSFASKWVEPASATDTITTAEGDISC